MSTLSVSIIPALMISESLPLRVHTWSNCSVCYYVREGSQDDEKGESSRTCSREIKDRNTIINNNNQTFA